MSRPPAARDRVLAAFPAPPDVLRAREIIQRTGLKENTVYGALRDLTDEGALVQAGYGVYRLPPPGGGARGAALASGPRAKGAAGAPLPAPYDETWALTVYTHVRASAGAGLFGWEPSDEGDVLEVNYSKRLIAELLGFVPPANTRAIRVDGWSMKRANGGLDNGQIVLYQPIEQIANGRRHILGVLDEGSEDVRILVKRVQAFIGGGLKIISDNRAAGIEDEVLLPAEGGALVNERTKRVARVGVLGTLLWPSEYEDEQTIRAVNLAIERLIADGYLNDPATFRTHASS